MKRRQILDAIIMTLIGITICILSETITYRNPEGVNVNGVVAETKVEEPLGMEEHEVEVQIPDDLYIIRCDGYINLRETPDIENNYNVVASLYDLTPCTVISDDGTWAEIQIADKAGYVQSKYISKANGEILDSCKILTGTCKSDVYEYDKPCLSMEDILVPGASSMYAEAYNPINAGWGEVELHSKDTEYSNILGILVASSKVYMVDYDKDWYAILNEDNTYTFCKKADIEVTNEQYRTYGKPKNKASFMSEFSNFGVYNGNATLLVRETSSMSSRAVGILPPSSGIDIIQELEDCYEISSGILHGFVPKGSILTDTEAKVYGEKHAKLKLFTSYEIENIYTEPSRLAKVWTRAGKNQVYDVISRDGYWVEVDIGDGDISSENPDRAYISIDDGTVEVKYSLNVGIPYIDMLGNSKAPEEVMSSTEESLRKDIIGYACQFIGNPYVWGGESLTNGADCSGFVRSVLKKYNIYIPRVSRDQAKVGLLVDSPNKLKPGDLVFYANSAGVVNHVAMYIGNGMIVNAGSAKSGICINTYNYRQPVMMRDMIGSR